MFFFFFVYRGDELLVHGYLDASFQSNIENRKSTLVIFDSK